MSQFQTISTTSLCLASVLIITSTDARHKEVVEIV